MTLPELDALSTADLAALVCAGYKRNGRSILGYPCPVCGADKGRDGRGRLAILDHGFVCNANQCRGSRGDLLCYRAVGKPWADCTREERDRALGGTSTPPKSEPDRAPVYLDGDMWAAILAASIPARQDGLCCEWASGRRLRLPAEARALVGAQDEALPLWSSSRDGRVPRWLPAMGQRLLLPMVDGRGVVRSARLRNIWPRDGAPKEVALPGYSSVGLVYASAAMAMRWADGLVSDRPVVLVEGGPDRMAAGYAWGRECEIIGIVSGSCSGRPWARWLDMIGSDVIMVPQFDRPDARGKRAGDEYARKVRDAAPQVRIVPMAKVYGIMGLECVEGQDLAKMERLPPMGDVLKYL